jgi:hypothetical protein
VRPGRGGGGLPARLLVAALALVLLVGCTAPGGATAGGAEQNGPGVGAPAVQPLISPVPAEVQQELVLYFPHRDRPLLVQEVRRTAHRGEQPEVLVLRELLRGPTVPAAGPVLIIDPSQAEHPLDTFGGAKVVDGTITLLVRPDVAAALRAQGPLAVWALVNSLAGPGRVERVAFRVDDHHGPYLIGDVDIQQPLSPRWDLVDGAGSAP